MAATPPNVQVEVHARRPGSRIDPQAATSDAALRASPNTSTGTARVLLRNASASPPSPSPTSSDMSGDGSSIGWTPTASTRPEPISNAT